VQALSKVFDIERYIIRDVSGHLYYLRRQERSAERCLAKEPQNRQDSFKEVTMTNLARNYNAMKDKSDGMSFENGGDHVYWTNLRVCDE
jgi:hypothetical protein